MDEAEVTPVAAGEDDDDDRFGRGVPPPLLPLHADSIQVEVEGRTLPLDTSLDTCPAEPVLGADARPVTAARQSPTPHPPPTADRLTPKNAAQKLRGLLKRGRRPPSLPKATVALGGAPGPWWGGLVRARSAKETERDRRIQQIVQFVDTGQVPLRRTPSLQWDIAAAQAEDPEMDDAAAHLQAARTQRMRTQLQLIDSEVAEAKAQLVRSELLRGPSGKRYKCDGDCYVGGCGEEFAEEDGVLCSGCQLFLCHTCFGSTVVRAEVQVSGRYDKHIEAESPAVGVSEPGSLPCPLFPQMCACGHIPLHTIQRALLHPSNRGRDGAEEDVNSSGHSAHKLHLLARRRWAEEAARQAQAPQSGQEGTAATAADIEDEGVALVRTFTESAARRANMVLARKADRVAVLADKLDELEELQAELQAHPVLAPIPAYLRRTCAQ